MKWKINVDEDTICRPKRNWSDGRCTAAGYEEMHRWWMRIEEEFECSCDGLGHHFFGCLCLSHWIQMPLTLTHVFRGYSAVASICNTDIVCSMLRARTSSLWPLLLYSCTHCCTPHIVCIHNICVTAFGWEKSIDSNVRMRRHIHLWPFGAFWSQTHCFDPWMNWSKRASSCRGNVDA